MEENTDFGQFVNLPLPSESIPGRRNDGAGKREKRDHPRRSRNKCETMAAGESADLTATQDSILRVSMV